MKITFKERKKQANGITLIALVITIVVLLILASVSIAMLTGENGILKKASAAQKKHNEIISEVVTEQAQKGKKATINDLYEYVLNDDKIQMKKETETTAIIATDGYAFRINEDLKIIESVSMSLLSNIEATYIINSVNGNNMNVTITVVSSTEIETINTSDGDTITANGNELTIDYDIISGQNYAFNIKLKNVEELKEYILKADTNAKPIVNQETSGAYPIINENGIGTTKNINIDYGESVNNYYSLDNGSTWQRYTGVISVKSAGTIMAKTINDNEITKVISENYTMDLASDALPSVCYDGQESTYFTNPGALNTTYTYKLEIDETVQGKSIKVVTSETINGGANLTIKFTGTNNEELDVYERYGAINEEFSISANSNNVYFIISGSYPIRERINEVSLVDSPDIVEVATIYPKITSDGIKKGYKKVKISYLNKCLQKKYKIGESGEWINYNSEEIPVMLRR